MILFAVCVFRELVPAHKRQTNFTIQIDKLFLFLDPRKRERTF